MIWQNIVDEIPDFAHYLTADELEASTWQLKQDYPDLVEVQEIGASRAGHPLNLIRIGTGPHRALWMGGGHPNEPLGSLVIDYFTRLLCENTDLRESLDYTWYFIKCLDPDGSRRNEKWLTQKFDLKNYLRHSYRPPVLMQPEFTFPHTYKDFHFDDPLPEAQAILNALEIAQPDLYYSLHCGSYGGAFYGFNRPLPALYPLLQDILDRLNLYRLPYSFIVGDVGDELLLADGIFQQSGLDYIYENLVTRGEENPAQHIPHGGTGIEIAQKYNAFMLNAEVDYCQDARIRDESLTEIPLKDVLIANQKFWEAFLTKLAVIPPVLNEFRVPFNLTLIPHLDLSIPDLAIGLPPVTQMATVQQIHLYSELPRLRVLREIGQFLNMLELEIADSNPSSDIENVYQMLEHEFEIIWEDLAAGLTYRAVPLRELVGYQLVSGLVTAEVLQLS